MTNQEIMDELLAAHKRSYKRAYNVAKATKTALIFDREGKLVEIYPHKNAAPNETAPGTHPMKKHSPVSINFKEKLCQSSEIPLPSS